MTIFEGPLEWFSYAGLTVPLNLQNDSLILSKWKKSLADKSFFMTGFIGVIRTQSNVRDKAFCGIANCLNCFCKKCYLRCLTGFIYTKRVYDVVHRNRTFRVLPQYLNG